MPYTASNVPTYVPKSKAKQWAAIWNAAYEEKIKAGATKEKAESYAFAVASGKAGPNAKIAEDTLDKIADNMEFQEFMDSVTERF